MYVSRLSRLPSLRRSFASSAPLGSLSAAARPVAEQISAEWKGTSATGGTTKNFIGGEFVESNTSEWIELLDPVRLHQFCCSSILMYCIQSTQTLLSRVPQTTNAEFNQAADAAAEAYKTWSRTSVITRQRFVMQYVVISATPEAASERLQTPTVNPRECRCDSQ